MASFDRERPDPDRLLAELRREEERAARGRLRIYFGASAGVGKTFAMLSAARKLASEGTEVVVGIVETHGRADTAALMEGLPTIPRRVSTHKGHGLEEFDLDAALARRPQLILVDELAHTNAPNSRHPKRWQDVDELLDRGIDVFTTLNVQHLESLNDVVGGITGIRVWETLPDTFFDRADEVVLVDVTADELLGRLKAGKVYLPDQAERAGRNFFRKGNLIALRELALRRTADRLEDDVQSYRTTRAIERVWKTEASLLCCVGPAPGGERVVRAAARLATQLNAEWMAVYAETPALSRLPAARRDRILQLLKLAQDLGASTTVLSGGDAVAAVIDYARAHNASKIVLGRARPRWWSIGQRPFDRRLASVAPEVDVVVVGRNTKEPEGERGIAPQTPASGESAGRVRWHGYLWAALSCVVPTLVAMPLLPYFDLANIVMLFLLTVVVVAVAFGRGPAALAAFASVASFDFFFVPPRFSFAVSDVQYLLTFAVMLAVGLITGQLTAGLRFQASLSRSRERRSSALYEFARELSTPLRTDDVAERTSDFVGRIFEAEVAVLVPDDDGSLGPPIGPRTPSAIDVATAQWAFDRTQPAGHGTDTLSGNEFLYLPLSAPMRTRGVLAIRPRRLGTFLVPEQRRQLDAFAALVAIALERTHYVDVAQRALVRIESERLRNSLLSALSHDLRTPLAALFGLADTLKRTPPLSAPQADIVDAIREAAGNMSGLVNNLLDMARLESGDVKLRLDWNSIEEVVGAALRSARHALARHRIEVRIAEDVPLVEFDAVLIERVLVNLLDNAGKFTPPGSLVTVSAVVSGGHLVVSVADDGPGVPPGREEAIFEKFTRGERESATAGMGLGLAICRGIVAAHHGTIRAENRAQGGAVLSFTLPLGTPPELPDGAAAPAGTTAESP